MEWQIKRVKVTEIFLDSNNIRIPLTNANQKALIQDLFMNEDAYDIVKSIDKYGLFPDEFPIIVIEKSKRIVIEGNRRLAALKALINNDLVPAFKSKLLNCTSKFEEINVVISPSREDATTLIANKHTINLRKPWKPLRQAYFYKSQMDNGKSIEDLIAEYPDHDIIKFIRMLEIHKMAKSIEYPNPEISNNVHDERKFPITNLERMYSDPAVRKFLGFDFNNKGEIKGKIVIEEFNKGLKVIVEDVATGTIDSRKFNSGKQRLEYLDNIPAENIPDHSKKGRFTSKSVKEVKTHSDNETEQNTAERSNRMPKGLFSPSQLPFKISNSSLRLMYNELKGLSISKFPNAAHDLLRSFLECLLVFYLKKHNEYEKVAKDQRHNPKLSELLTYLASAKCKLVTDPNIIQLIHQIKSQYSESYSLERMNMINHNENWVSSESDVRTAWARLEPLIKIFLIP